MKNRGIYENGFLIVEDYNFITYTKTNGKKISWYGKNKKFNNFNIGTYLYKILKNYNVSFINKSKILKLIVENKFYEKIVKNVKLIIKSIIKLKNKVENVYLFIKFVSSKCILKMSTFYYLKYIIEQIYQKKLEKIVRVVLPISDLHKLYSYIYFQNFLITNYYEHILSKTILNELKMYYGLFIILNKHSKNVTQVYEKIYGLDFITLNEEKCKSKKNKNKKITIHNIINAKNDKKNNNTPNNTNKFLKFCENSNTQNMNNCKELKQEENINDSYIKINKKTRHILKCVKIEKGRCRNKYKKQTDIKIEKYKIQKTVYKNLNKNDIGLFAGTFDKIHMGHTLLLFYSILLTNKFFYIGLYNNKNIYKKKYCEEIDDLKLRIFHIYDILFLISNAYNIQFIFYNFDSVIPFIKIKNSHTILYQIAMKNNKNKFEEISELYRDKYRKYISDSYYKNCNKYNQKKNTFFMSKYTTNLLKKKYQSLIKTNIEKLYQNENWRGNKILCSNKYKKKILNYLKFHINYNQNKSEKKIIVLKRIHDPFSFALDIRDMFCLTMSKESEVNGYNIVQRRKLLFQKNKTSLIKSEQIEHNLPIATDNNNNNRDKGSDDEKIKTCLNIFDTINISNREKMSSTLIRMENSIYRKGKFSKYLKYFIEACLYFNIDHFLIQMHVDIFLKKNGKKNFKKLYLNTIKSYFCRRKKNSSNKNGINKNVKGKNFYQNKKNDNFIVNDFFRHLFVLISFFINHFSKKYYTQNKIQFFIKISIIISFFFYNNILLKIIKKKEQFINQNFIINNKSIKQTNCLFDANYEDIFRIYISNMKETIMEEIVNQILILILMILSTSIICKMFHFDLFPNFNSSKNMTNLQKVCDLEMLKKKKHLPCYQIKQNIKNDKDILYDSKKKNKNTEKNDHYNILEDERSNFKKYYFNLYFSNYFKTKKTFYRSSIITPYTMCNYTLMRKYKNKNYNMLPYQYCKCVKKGIQKKGNSLYSNVKNNTSNNNKLVNDVNSDNIKKKKKNFAHNFNFDYSNKKDIQIINNLYTIKIRENGEKLNDQNKLSENDIINYVTKNTLLGNIYSERFNYFIKININNNDKIMFFRKILIYKFIDNYFISFFSFYFLNYLINEENKTKQNIHNMNINDFVFIFLIHFETHIEMIINSYIKRQWRLRQKNYYDPFYPFIQYQKKYSIIHKYMHMNLSPLNDYNIDFEKIYNFKKNNTNFKNTPFYIKLENMKDTSNYNVLSFYNIIFQHILTYENYYYPYFAALNYLHLNLF
ncbi:phosphopantetheine adenylyltransferase [Plasmodium yoelii]|uniref:Phosphopantetheine adenylyltransferase n=2 Tax=Plasmodium yoelii TaxID=5861 RepID=A0AAE9WM19_PLAYO|nr:phosphopantetheine adenylyltransferase [Plasmodium yoelii]WBY56553.1 phosphopantetheine adenylyltransferase [Plasmodium yoelii yoelii]CDU17415.1 phosphopantetheine adenylyltransferase, putative [Plasmodium yoelii]VTZ77106.1 phosphopantetheine adenylyltransferase [Plasmodium yoelii]|eukprot:XP_726603.2 phosphopantetheine adenylyltransferase [Plasmodium yoelii]